MSCTHSSSCQLFPQFAAEPALKIWQQHFCEGEFKKCARYQRSMTGQVVPLELLPNGKELAVARSQDEVNINVLFNAIQKNRIGMVQSIFKASPTNQRIRNSAGTTPLMFAAELGNIQMVDLLLKLGSNPNATNNTGKNAMQIAEEKGHDDCVQSIREAIKNIQSSDTVNHVLSDADQESMGQVLKFLRKINPFKKAS